MGSMGKKLTSYSKTAVDKSKRFSVSQPGLMKWGTRAAVGIVAVGALALGVDAVRLRLDMVATSLWLG